MNKYTKFVWKSALLAMFVLVLHAVADLTPRNVSAWSDTIFTLLYVCLGGTSFFLLDRRWPLAFAASVTALFLGTVSAELILGSDPAYPYLRYLLLPFGVTLIGVGLAVAAGANALKNKRVSPNNGHEEGP